MFYCLKPLFSYRSCILVPTVLVITACGSGSPSDISTPSIIEQTQSIPSVGSAYSAPVEQTLSLPPVEQPGSSSGSDAPVQLSQTLLSASQSKAESDPENPSSPEFSLSLNSNANSTDDLEPVTLLQITEPAFNFSAVPSTSTVTPEQIVDSDLAGNTSESQIIAESILTVPDLVTDSATTIIPDTPALGASIPSTSEPTSEPASEPAELLAQTLTVSALSIGNNIGDVEKILSNIPVSKSQLNVQQTPVDTEHGFVYTVNIEHGPNGDTNGTDLRTVLRQGRQDVDGIWQWTDVIIEDRTVYDVWHTAPSVAADKNGFVHVAYNMHNMPWQYKRSDQPHSVDAMTFHGQHISQAQIDRWKWENKTWFPTNGTGEIPGNQITYPQFKKDNNRDLYVSYRFAAKPAATWEDRTMSGGVSRYSTQDLNWTAVGGTVNASASDFEYNENAPDMATAIAANQGWTVYHPRLMFGPDDQMHLSLFWREGTAGAELSSPCYFKSEDGYNFTDAVGNYFSLPVSASDCGNIGFDATTQFYSIGNSAMDSTGKPFILVSPIGDVRKISSYDDSTGWTHEDAPLNATEIFFDKDDTMWAVASGIRVLKREKNSNEWDLMYSDSSGTNCYPKSTVNAPKTLAFIHAQACDESSVTVYGVRLK